MTGLGIGKIAVYLALISALTPLLGGYMKRVFAGERTLLDPILRPIERGIYRICGVDAAKDQGWMEWTIVMLAVNAVSLVVLYGMQRLQKWLPFNPNGFGPVAPDSSWNTAVSFTTNTNWQGYSGETTMSHFTQMAGLALHNFLSAATGIAIARRRRESETSGSTARARSCGCCCPSPSWRPSSSCRAESCRTSRPTWS
jgi:K+-transporting ATPase ATPase A chain